MKKIRGKVERSIRADIPKVGRGVGRCISDGEKTRDEPTAKELWVANRISQVRRH